MEYKFSGCMWYTVWILGPHNIGWKNQRNIADPQNSTLEGEDGSYTVFPEGA